MTRTRSGDAGSAKLVRRPAKVLIADDDPIVRHLLRMVLETEGYAVTQARNGEEALVQLSREVPDLLILDIVMPEVDGREVLRRVSSSPHLSQIPVLVMSGTADQKAITGSHSISGFLAKPFDLDAVLMTVERILRQSAHECEHSRGRLA